MALVKIFARGRVGYTAGFVRLTGRQASALPLAKKPVLETEAFYSGFENVLDADLRNHGKSADLAGVHIACDVALALVPDICVDIAPSVLLKDGVDSGPADFRIPEPESCPWSCASRPCGDMRLVPGRKVEVIGSVSFEPKDAVPAIGDDDCRNLPLAVKIEAVSELHGYELVGPPLDHFGDLNGTHRPPASYGTRWGGPFRWCFRDSHRSSEHAFFTRYARPL